MLTKVLITNKVYNLLITKVTCKKRKEANNKVI